MKEEIIKIKNKAAVIFNNLQLVRFCKYIDSHQYNNARLMIDDEIHKLTNEVVTYDHNGLEIAAACNLIDLIIDLIVNEIDDDREKQIKPIIRKRRKRGRDRPNSLVQ
jgi:hypothetical protein